MPTNEDRGRDSGLGAAAVGLAALGVGEAIAATRGGSLVDTLNRALADHTPVPGAEAVIAKAGDTADHKAKARLGLRIGAVAVTVLLGALPQRLRTPLAVAFGAGTAALAARPPMSSPATAAGAVAAAGVLVTGLRRRPRGPLGVLGLGALGGGLLVAAHTLHHDLDRKQDNSIRRIGAMGAAGAVPQDGLEDEPGLSPLVTSARRMYVADVTSRAPRIDPQHWRLSVTGRVAHPLRLSLAELAEDAVDFDAAMVCVHHRPGQDRAANGRWFGVPLARLLEHTIPEPDATRLVTRAVDGYTISLPVEPLRSGEWPGYVVIGMNGEPLTPAHGFPARVFVPGIYGQYTGAKWLGALELTDDSHVDYWWRRGWPTGPLWVTPQARIDVTAPARSAAGSTTVAGVAWAPPRGVEGVEVRVGGGDWQRADLGAELAPAAWRRWRTTVPLPPGEHTVQARAISRSGEVQQGRQRPPFPTGPAGFHTVTVRV